ncbi:hypothetical protein [Actinoplanes sp. L3-i22]|uniref:hypothetical protein n=1 Tax=Actinoplanes sp. L3-i22 TaxID=2836373 RepID=UPI001C74E6DF|nr:hypothetical protein [Actinoplanes sp. L3-i22]BCY06412.1 hypothetical protein L3i22_015000 [Actinoplanes sp. L3-i22]
MSSQEGRNPMDRRTAASLLRGDRATTGHPLSAVLAAAQAPAAAGELAGEADALTAFRAAAQSPDVVPLRRRPMLAKLLTLKVAAAVFATTATVGGVALAASTGALPNPISSNKPSHSAQPSPSASRSHSARPVPSGSALPDLCKEWGGKDRDHRTKALDDAHFGELVKRAGAKDRDRVERFCGLHKPDPSGKPGGRPSGRPSTPPSGRPGLPSGLPKTPQEPEQHG